MASNRSVQLVKSIELLLGGSRGPHMVYDPHLGYAADESKPANQEMVRWLYSVISDESISDKELQRQIEEEVPELKGRAGKLVALRKNPAGR